MNEPRALPEPPISTSDFPPPTSWPPRAGWKFFFLWTATHLVWMLVARFVFPIVILAGEPVIDWGTRAGRDISDFVFVAWTGYLLFPLGFRLMLWVVIPTLLNTALLAWLGPGSFSPSEFEMIMGTVAWFTWPALQAALMVGVRRRPWAWFVAKAADQLLYIYAIFLFQPFDGLIRWAEDLTASITGYQLVLDPHIGIQLLGIAVCAYVLAFWMPPIAREDRTTSPAPVSPSHE